MKVERRARFAFLTRVVVGTYSEKLLIAQIAN
jgi:hypothetical protein